jgi:adenine-specific DNA glycosylase
MIFLNKSNDLRQEKRGSEDDGKKGNKGGERRAGGREKGIEGEMSVKKKKRAKKTKNSCFFITATSYKSVFLRHLLRKKVFFGELQFSQIKRRFEGKEGKRVGEKEKVITLQDVNIQDVSLS